jgi:type I restriction-modification system DNA methylase subunit
MLFLKRCTDVFAERYDQIIQDNLKRGRTQSQAKQRAGSPDFYADSFFVPERARWPYLRDEVHKGVGGALNKALGDMEDGWVMSPLSSVAWTFRSKIVLKVKYLYMAQTVSMDGAILHPSTVQA